MGVMDAFSKTGPNRPPAIEDVPDAAFEAIFGPPLPPFVSGGKTNLKHLAKVVEWNQNRRIFDGLADFEIDETVAATIMETTESVPVAWRDKRGNVYIAIVGATPVYRLSPKLFGNPNVGDPEVYVWTAIIARGGYVPNLPADRQGIDVLRKKNEANNPNPTPEA